MNRKIFLMRLLVASLTLPCLTTPLYAGKYSSGGGRSYSSGSSSSRSSSPSPSPSRSASPAPSASRSSAPAPSVSTQRSSYSAGAGAARTAPAANTSTDAAAAKAKQVQQSSQNFAQSKAANTPPPVPRGSYASRNTASGNTATNRTTRTTTTRVVHHYPAFSSYYSRPVVFYHDSYSSPFWYWLLDQPRPIRAAWYYNHASTMDPARQAALVAADPALTQEVTQIAATTPKPDPNYVPAGIEAQAMTAAVETEEVPATDEDDANESASAAPLAVAAVAPAAATPAPVRYAYGRVATRRSSSWLGWFMLLGCGGLVTWLVFFKRWKPKTNPS